MQKMAKLHPAPLWYLISLSCDGVKKVQVGNDQGKAQSERNYHTKTKLTIRYLYLKTYRKPSVQLFTNRRPLSYMYQNLNKNMKKRT